VYLLMNSVREQGCRGDASCPCREFLVSGRTA